MKIKSLGHVVLRVTDLERAERFYGDVLGLPVCAHMDEVASRRRSSRSATSLLRVDAGLRRGQHPQ